jgi:CheY-like chemotaxis protein
LSEPNSIVPGSSALAGGFRGFQDLMRFRVQDILLVSSLYDSFILAEDGRLQELIFDEFTDLNLRHMPGLTHVSTGARALELAREQPRFNLIIASMDVGDMNALDLAGRVREAGLQVPVILLAYDNRELTDFVARHDVTDLDRIFLWQGDVRILVAIVKYVEDRMNVAHDTGVVGVQAVIVIEDNIRFYSSFLPMIYTEVMKQSQSLIPEGVNLAHKMMRIRARPKILLATTYEEARGYFERYREELLGIISDMEFPRGGSLDRDAGVALCREARRILPDLPVMLQSSFRENEIRARSVGAGFLLKGSPVLLQQLRRFMVENFSFGDFVFRLSDGTEVGRAPDLKTLERLLRTVPAESLAFHGERNHFSSWLKARTEFDLAERLRPRKVSDFATLEDLREDLIQAISGYRGELARGMVADFDRTSFDGTQAFVRIGGGSLGGKARGLAFVNRLLGDRPVSPRFPGVRVAVPPWVVLGTDVFDRFLEENDLRAFALDSADEAETLRRFLWADFPALYLEDLRVFVEKVRYPLAVRSSSLLEDSKYQPFAGVYETYMVPNNNPDPKVRLARLVDAIKRVYASTFSRRAKAYLGGTPYRLEEEKMGVILQRMVGAAHRTRFYPDFAGVARSHNFYPTAPMRSEDGIAAVALGLGKTVCDGDACVRFSPRYPHHLLQFSSVEETLRSAQQEFWALELEGTRVDPASSESAELRRWPLAVAEEDGTLGAVGSTYVVANDAVYDGISRPGTRVVSFAPVLKHGMFPLAEILQDLLALGVEGTRSPVELEFAVALAPPEGGRPEFGFLQLRPLAFSRELEEIELGEADDSELVCRSSSVLGHGNVADLRDVVMVDYHRFERAQSREVAREVARFNAELQARGVPYLLIGVGRWGSSDPHLGIPVTWDQIAGVRVIVEAGFRDFRVTPSQGTHFFQNLTSCNVGYFTVNPEAGEGMVDWEWLASQPAAAERGFVRHLRLDAPLVVKMDGRRNEGLILKPRR